MADPPFEAGFALWSAGLAVLREMPRGIARAWRAWRNISCPATGKVEIITAP
jgi:hypothetical protein